MLNNNLVVEIELKKVMNFLLTDTYQYTILKYLITII